MTRINFTRTDVETSSNLERLLLRIVKELDSVRTMSSALRTLPRRVMPAGAVEGPYSTVFRSSPSGNSVYDEQNRTWINAQNVSTTYPGLVPVAPGNGTYWLNGLTGAWVRLGYGSCWGNDIGWAQASAAQNTWYPVSDSDISDGELAGVTHDGSGKLTVADAGVYKVSWAIVIDVSLANKHVLCGIGVTPDGGALTPQDRGQQHVELLAATSDQPVSGIALLSLSALDAVEVIVSTTDTGTPDLEVSHINLVLQRIS